METIMALTICLTFVGTSLLYALIGCVACWRVARHLRGNPVGTTAVVEHLLIPFFGPSARLGVTLAPVEEGEKVPQP
jgi:hypothetical protein